VSTRTVTAPLAHAKVKRRRKRGASPLEWALLHIAFLLTAVFFVAPFIWLFLAAFDSQAQPYIKLPTQVTLQNFVYVFAELNFAGALANSLVIATVTMIVAVVTVSLAGYSMSRAEFRAKNVLTYGILLLQTMPLAATMVPIYGLARQLGLRNSYLGLILFHTAIELPFLIWLMKGYFDTVPRYLEEAAWLDGRSRLRALFEIVLPVARTGIGVAAGLAFLDSWSEVLLVLILIDHPSMYTVPLAFYQAFRTNGGYTEVRYDLVAAMAVLYLLPVMAIFFATRKYMVRGLSSATRGF
jgi:multiple sugar transport system permease protein